jgi:hypothetical protein
MIRGTVDRCNGGRNPADAYMKSAVVNRLGHWIGRAYCANIDKPAKPRHGRRVLPVLELISSSATVG